VTRDEIRVKEVNIIQEPQVTDNIEVIYEINVEQIGRVATAGIQSELSV